MRKYLYLGLAVVAAIAVISSCKKSDDKQTQDPGISFDRKGMLTNISTNIILPAYTAFHSTVVDLDAAVTAFNTAPDEAKLETLQTAFKAAYKQWQATSVFEVGPAEQENFRFNTNTYPVDLGQINANITSGTYNPEALANLAAKGLPAMDYLLFGTGADNNAILIQYTTDSKAANRKSYLAALSTELKTNITTILTTWNNGYAGTFNNADGTDAGSSTGQLVNQLVYDYEVLKNYEIGIPAGVQSMGTAYPEKVQAYYSGMSVQLALLHLQTIENIYLGKSAQGDGLGLDDYLIKANATYSNGAPLNDVIKNQFAVAMAKLQALNDPLSAQITGNNAAVTAAYTELQKLTVLLKTDMTSALGILITYGDNDGD